MRLMKVTAVVVGLAALGGCAGTGGGLFARSDADTPSGAYLAGRYASAVNDGARAAGYYDTALDSDPKDPVILERAFMAALTAGEMPRAVSLAKRIVEIEPGERMARLTLSLAAVKNGDYAAARDEIAAAAPGPFTVLVGTLTSAWAAAGEGDKALALEKLGAFDDRVAFALFRAYHQGLMLDMLGSAGEADAAYMSAMETSGGGSIRVVQAYASFLQRQGRPDAAKEALETFLTLSSGHPLAEDYLARLAKGEKLPPLVSDASEGVAEALYGLGSALTGDTTSELAGLYLNLALYMRPDFDIARSLLAGLYEAQERWQDAIGEYAHVENGSPLSMNARIQTAMALDRLDREPDAIRTLERLARDRPDAVEPFVAMGDIYRAKEKYAEAAAQYERAIALSGEPDESDWTLYYARGICFERLGEWDKAEADLTLALTLSGEHPLVLNYLGYSWIEQNRNLDEALAMIEKAVQRRPNDGFIVDSLGWARYRLGDYALAVKYLERAAELEPGDPTINEHLGDALWKVGRKIEARFQWNHALAAKPEEKRLAILRKKLDFGLEAAEKSEGGTPAPGPAGS